MITDLMVFFWKPSLTKVCFNHTRNVFQDVPESPNQSKNIAKRKKPQAITVLKKEGGWGSGEV